MYYCFPTSVQAGSTQPNDTRNYELDLVGEIADSIVEFAARLLKRQPQPHMVMTHEEKLLAARNSRDQGLLAVLATDADAAVRSEVTFNAYTPMYVLQQLAHDDNRFIAAQAKAKLQIAA